MELGAMIVVAVAALLVVGCLAALFTILAFAAEKLEARRTFDE